MANFNPTPCTDEGVSQLLDADCFFAKSEYWDRLNCDQLPPLMANALYDIALVGGVEFAERVLKYADAQLATLLIESAMNEE